MRNRTIIFGVSIVALLCLTLFLSRHERVFLAKPLDPLVLSVNLDSKDFLKKELYGFNTNQMNAEYTYSDPEFYALTSKLEPQSLRFPGGAVANFYHWKTSDFSEDELQSSNSATLNNRNLQNNRRLVSRRRGKISFDEFMGLCQKLDIKPVIVLNLYTGSPAESADWVRYAQEKGYKVASWELGNELYLEAYRNKFPTVEAYIEVAKQHAAAIKAVDSQAKLAAVASTVGFHLNKRDNETELAKAWDNRLAQESFFDFYTLHLYSYSRVRQSLSFNQLRGLLFGSSDIAFKEAMEYYEQVFGNREAWVTEWNIANPRNNAANTQLHAMYCGDFFLSLLKYQDRVSIANYHVLAGSGDGFPVFSPRTNEDVPGESRSVKRACYPVFQLIGEALGKSEEIYSTTLKNNPQFQGSLEFKNEFIESFKSVAVGKINQNLAIFVINRSPDSHNIQLEVNGKPLTNQLQYNYVTDLELAATNRNRGNQAKADKEKSEVKIQKWNGLASELRIPGNSFGVIEQQ